MSDLEQAVDRLSHAVMTEETRKVVFLTGSGISTPQVPGTREMVDIFLSALGASTAQALRKKIANYSPADQYTTVAEELQRRRGDIGLASAIGMGVSHALKKPHSSNSVNPESISDADWEVPEAQNLLAKLISRVPTQQSGAIITTNFDSLTEVALRNHHVQATSLAVPGSMAFPIDAVWGALPVIHLHGFWGNSATLSTAAQLDTERPQIERMITRLLDNAILVVIGYGGWNDSFTRALMQMVRDGHTTSLKTEIMWLNYGKKEVISSHTLLRELQRHAGVNIYCEIDAVKFLEGVIQEIGSLKRQARKTFLGWTPPVALGVAPKLTELLGYVEGAEPNWTTAGEMSMLSNAHAVYDAVRAACADNQYEQIVVSAPAGEGKTTALLQVASTLAANLPEANILFRNPGAPRISAEWLDHLSSENDLSVLFVDDADLVINQIYHANLKRSNAPSGRIIWVLAFHPSYLQSSGVAAKLRSVKSRTLEFTPFSSNDALLIAESWKSHDLLPSRFKKQTNHDVAQMVVEAGDTIQGRSLFGSVLHLWGGDNLEARVEHMLAKVSNLSIAGVSYRSLLSAVAVTQLTWDEFATTGEGLSIAALGFFANTTNNDIVRLVVEPLGREVGISQIGDRVYMRHPSIARAIYNILRDCGELESVVRDIANKGCQMRYAKKYYNEDYHSAYLISRKLTGPEALAASASAVRAAQNRLEPRVTAIATLRDNGQLNAAQKYASKLSRQLADYEDQLQVQRGFYVEWSVVESKLERHDRALRLAVQAISDQVPGFLPVDKLEYGLSRIIRSAERLSEAKVDGSQDLLNTARRVLYRLPDTQASIWGAAFEDDNASIFELIREFRLGASVFAPAGTSFVKMQATLMENRS
ncbi:P-loop NTPase [Pseudarthrobacter sulfonivorans]|uniref:P-loop NTPase n=1 Tax=Pseudarthrobacter sulfonivorans TaxID=121292 RepID=UPI00278633A5|nr:SIR2 family protein [Pseudarthrobacter sulfonivorans]MDP9998312.1 hypothetical protein [Pseudarthrobacter sulfonivorans]